MTPIDLQLLQTIHRERLEQAERRRTFRRLRDQHRSRQPHTRRLRMPLLHRRARGRLA